MEVLQLLAIGSDEHIAHEESMVGTSADDSDLDLVFFVPSRITINNVNTISRIQVIDGTLAVDTPDLEEKNNVSKIERLTSALKRGTVKEGSCD